jgi:hypothetical protein
MEIFNILFQKKKLSFFAKLIGKSTKISESEKKLARAKFRTLEEISKHIVDKLDSLESRLKKLGPEQVAKLI